MFWFSRLTAERRRTIGHWLMELVIVVAGVLIALWLQQWGEHRRAMQNMRAAETSIHQEVRDSLQELLWRQAISKCHFERAMLLKTMLLKPGSHWPGLTDNALLQTTMSEAAGVQTVVQGVYTRPYDPFTRAAWNSALTTGALAPMDKARFAELVALYAQIDFMAGNRDREDRAASTLSALTFPQELTAETKTRMLQALYEVDSSRFMFAYSLPDFVASMSRLGWNDKAEIDRYIRDNYASIVKERSKWRSCVVRERNPFAGQAGAAKD
jgi:hypothetical protein